MSRTEENHKIAEFNRIQQLEKDKQQHRALKEEQARLKIEHTRNMEAQRKDAELSRCRKQIAEDNEKVSSLGQLIAVQSKQERG